MDVKSYLEQVKNLNDRMAVIKSEIERLDALLGVKSPRLDRPKGSATPRDALIIQIMGAKDKLWVEYRDCLSQQESVLKSLKTLPDRLFKIVYKKYFEFKSWEQIAEECDISQRHIYNLKNEAFDKIKDLIR